MKQDVVPVTMMEQLSVYNPLTYDMAATIGYVAVGLTIVYGVYQLIRGIGAVMRREAESNSHD